MDNLPNDPSNPNSGNNNPVPPFGSGFTPHTNPVDPNNPYQPQPPQNPVPQPSNYPNIPNLPNNPNPPEQPHNSVYSDIAQHKPRDSHGRFIHSDYLVNPAPQAPPTPSNPSSFIPPLVETNPKEYNKDPDPPIFTVRNPITYLKRWWNKILAKEGIDFKLGFKIRPITAVLIASIIISGGVSSGVTALVLKTFFPTSSPILHRQIIQQGTIQKASSGGFYLTSSDSSMWKLKPKIPNINLADQVGKQVTITGNMTKDKNVIEVSEIILPETGSSQPQNLSSQTTPNTFSPAPSGAGIPNQDLLPKLYPGLQWDLTQRKVLIFTSGKRKIEQEGIYLESALVTSLPQELINYYTQELTNTGFKETFNSSDPNGTTVTYAKDDLFLTFGIKNIYTGSGDNKKLAGYKAFLEHN